MAAKSVSPGAALLRSSRLFSLPAQLPPAPGDVSGSTRFGSDTATLPYPLLQAVASPRSSRSRGDWGFKRPLPPQAASARSDPLVRVRRLDTLEHVTDFASATDHAMTLRKWQALHVPLTAQTDAEQRQHLAGKSVFEEAADVIAIDPAQRHTAADKRWKFAGPWLAGITEGAFQGYLKKQVRTKRPEFREFLRGQLAADRNAAAAAAAMDRGSSLPRDASSELAAADITDAQLTDYLRVLRHDRPLLYRLVGKFLDLAPVEPSDKIFQSLQRSSSTAGGGFLSPLTGRASASAPGNPGNPWAQDGPPITHPSAGLSYLRTAAYLDNHPLYGPQKAHPPVQARVVAPRNASGSWSAKMGVAGFVADNPFGESAYSNTRHNQLHNNARALPGLSIIDPSIPGGAKLPVRVAAAKVNAQGRVIVSVAEADPEAVLVARELAGAAPQDRIFGQPARLLSTRADSQPRRAGSAAGGRFTLGARRLGGDPVISSPQNYGLGQ